MIKKENGSTPNKKPRIKKIIKLIIYIIVLGLLAFLSVKSCNLTLKALTPTATTWDDLNNVNIICNVDGNLSSELDANEYYYLNNGNDTSGLAQTPAFQIYDTYNGLAYDEIRIRQTDIKIRGYLYDSQDNYSDYYERTIWANDYVFENITPDTIRFENLSSDTPNNITGANVYYPNALNPFSAFLNIINISFDYAENYINIYSDKYEISNRNLEVNTAIFIDYSNTENYIKNIKIEIVVIYENNTSNITRIINNSVDYRDIINGNYNAGFILKKYWTISPSSSFIIEFDYNDYLGTQQIETINVLNNMNWYSTTFPENYINNNILYQEPLINYINEQQYNAGYGAGYRVGREVGEDVGYNAGYQEGYEDGASGEINTNWILSLMNTATSILNIEILPNIKLIYLVGAFIILAFVRFVIGWIR